MPSFQRDSFLIRTLTLVWLLVTLTACNPASLSSPSAATPVPQKNSVPPVTPTTVETPAQAAMETSLPEATQTVESGETDGREVIIPTPGGAELEGTLYGNGTTAVIFSHMSDSRQDSWERVAQVAAEKGYLALTFDFRFWSEGLNRNAMRGMAGEDLLAAIQFVRQQGAEKVVLVGASLGGLASARAALVESPAAVVILSAPLDWLDWPALTVTEQDIQDIQAPLLLINSECDRFAGDTERMFAAASDPKEMEIYPGAAHGTQLFSRGKGQEVMERILAFIQTYAPQ